MSEIEAAWRQLERAGADAAQRRLADLFAHDPERVEAFSLEAAGLSVDLSKQPWSRADLACALELARAARVEAARSALFAGERVNRSERRAVLHPALRAAAGAAFKADGESVSEEVEAMRVRIRAFSEAVRSGAICSATGRRFRNVVHIGIGGSDLGPRLVWEALRPLRPQIDLRFVANVDPAEFALVTAELDPAETLVVVVSKTFTTLETLANAEAARDWLRSALGSAADSHLVAVSAAPAIAEAFGVPAERVFAFWDWVGGRFSLWSAVGLSCVIALGSDVFEGLLDGARAMDAHFVDAPLEANGPVLLALAHVFNRNVLGRPIRAVTPYAHRLRLLPAFLQQLEMESNGKRVDALGRPLGRTTAASVFGDAGTNGQHAFFQMLHQGPDVIPLDIIAVAQASEGGQAAQLKLLANAVAQAEALMVGRTEVEVRAELSARGMAADEIDELAPQRTFPGDRPSSFILMDRLTPAALGALLALYEHKTFVEGVLWGVNSFDQWGVELGKTLASRVLGELEGGVSLPHDPSTSALVSTLRSKGG